MRPLSDPKRSDFWTSVASAGPFVTMSAILKSVTNRLFFSQELSVQTLEILPDWDNYQLSLAVVVSNKLLSFKPQLLLFVSFCDRLGKVVEFQKQKFEITSTSGNVETKIVGCTFLLVQTLDDIRAICCQTLLINDVQTTN